MARTATGTWIAGALALAKVTAGLDPSERRRELERRHRAGGISPQTAHRQMLAVQWIEQRATLYGVNIDDVKCAWMTAEALERLESARPEQAAKVIRDGLTGNLTSREVAKIASSAPSPNRRARDWPNEFEVFIIDDVGHHLPGGKASILYTVKELSPLGRMIYVDIEWVTADGVYAVFISPESTYARSPNITETFKGVTIARSFYQLVLFVSCLDDEQAFIKDNEPKRQSMSKLIQADGSFM